MRDETCKTSSDRGRERPIVRLAECLNHASVPTLRNIVTSHGLNCPLYSKHEMMQSILEHVRTGDQLARESRSWIEKWGDTLRRLALSGRSDFAQEEVEALFRHTQDNHGLSLALQQGWLYAQRDNRDRPLFVIPEDLLNAVRQSFVTNWKSEVTGPAIAPVLVKEEGLAILGDLQTLIDYVSHHEVRLTTEGVMYKRHLQSLMMLFEVPEDLEVPKWRFGYGRRVHDYPDRFSLLYDFAYHEGLLVEATDDTLCVGDAVSNWQATPRRVQLQRLLRFYLRVYRRPIPRLREIVETIRLIAVDWVDMVQTYHTCSSLIQAFYYDREDDVWAKRIVAMLVHLGVLRLGYDGESIASWFQITELGQELLTQDETHLVDDKSLHAPSLIVQPNFEIMVIVPDGGMESVIAQFADLKSAGSIRLYRILERTVFRGLREHHDFAAWRRLLERHGVGAIPGNVERTLMDWLSAYEKSNETLSS